MQYKQIVDALPRALRAGSRGAARACVTLLVGASLLLAGASAAEPQRFAEEDRDWGVAATKNLRQAPYHAPTPLALPGAQLVHTRELQAMLSGADRPILIDVLSGAGHETLAGAVWLGGAGRGETLYDPVQSTLVLLLQKLTSGDKAKPLVFFCASSQCWLSYNAALRAVAAGYTRVLWYRGGIDAWTDADLPTAKTVESRRGD